MILPRIKIAIKKFFRNKLNYIILILIGICFAFSTAINSLTYSATKYYENSVLNWVDNRIFFIRISDEKDADLPETKKKMIELTKKLNSMNEIEGVFDIYSYMYFFDFPELNTYFSDEKEVPAIRIEGVVSSIDTIYGEDLDKTDEMEMVCPSVYYPYERVEGVDKNHLIDLKPYVGKEMTIQALGLNNKYKVKLVGLYDNDILKGNYRVCYMNATAFGKINKTYASEENNYLYYQLKNVKDAEKVNNIIQDMGYWPISKVAFTTNVAVESLDILILGSRILLIISILITVLLVYYNTIKNKKSTILNQILGYKRKDLIFNYFVDSLIFFSLFLIFSIAFSSILIIIFKKIIPIYYTSFEYIKIVLSPLELSKSALYLLIISFSIGLFKIIINSNSIRERR